MSNQIHQCTSCNAYTLKESCSKCGEKAVLPRPPKFSLNDKYASYRRAAKIEELKEKGLY